MKTKKIKLSIPKEREEIMLQVRETLAEHFDVGVAVVSWEDEGETYYMDFKFGNDYAAKSLCMEAGDMLWPCEEEEEEEEV
jgi:hypothetical protein